MNDVEIVELKPDGKCPRCGADYGKPLTSDQRDGGARFEAQQNAGLDY